MDNLEITEMNISDLEKISNNLFKDFDDFWRINTLKEELENPNSKYIVIKQNNSILGFGGIWKAVYDMHITNIVVKKNFRRKRDSEYPTK